MKNEDLINKERKNFKDMKKSKSPYVKKIVSKEKKVVINKSKNSNISKDKIINIKVIQESKNSNNKNQNNNKDVNLTISKMSKRNFNEILFNYKKYSLINNNPIKRKTEFENELKKTKKLKDMSMKKKKKGWIKKDTENNSKICLSKNNQKSKNIFDEFKVINFEENDNKFIQNLDLDLNAKEDIKEHNDDKKDINELINFDVVYKKSQDDFNIDFMNNNFGIDNIGDTNDTNDPFIGKYKQYLKNKKMKKNKYNNSEFETELKFFEDLNKNL